MAGRGSAWVSERAGRTGWSARTGRAPESPQPHLSGGTPITSPESGDFRGETARPVVGIPAGLDVLAGLSGGAFHLPAAYLARAGVLSPAVGDRNGDGRPDLASATTLPFVTGSGSSRPRRSQPGPRRAGQGEEDHGVSRRQARTASLKTAKLRRVDQAHTPHMTVGSFEPGTNETCRSPSSRPERPSATFVGGRSGLPVLVRSVCSVRLLLPARIPGNRALDAPRADDPSFRDQPSRDQPQSEGSSSLRNLRNRSRSPSVGSVGTARTSRPHREGVSRFRARRNPGSDRVADAIPGSVPRCPRRARAHHVGTNGE